MKKIWASILLLPLFILHVQAQVPTEIWGVTKRGGSGFGTVFKMDSYGNNPFQAYTFDGKISAKNSYIQFHEAGNGKLYAAMAGGIYDNGVIVELDPATGTITEKAHFNSMQTGDSPNGMIWGPNGKFYGTLNNSNTPGKRETIFEYDIVSNTITSKASFNGINGRSPFSDMLLAKNGKLYGVTNTGGLYDKGVLYEYDLATDSIIKKVDFDESKGGGYPGRGLVEYDNKLYGLAATGGTNSGGSIYEYDIAGNTLVTKYKIDKTHSKGGLTLGNDGLLYGATLEGPTYLIPGVFFKFDPVNSIYTVIQNFDFKTTGTSPYGSLKKCKNGLLYGMLAQGGQHEGGSIFEYNPVTSKFKIVFNFKDTLGTFPYSVLEQAKNGKLYGGTQKGGKYGNWGVLFEFDILYHHYKKLQDLGDGQNGDRPSGTLSLAGNGKIYTVTAAGGKHDLGVLLECDPSLQPGIFTKKIDFTPTTGVSPLFAPVQGANGKLYGTTPKGGKNTLDDGTIYEYDPIANTLVTKVYFSDSTWENGYYPVGLTLASNNKFYGVTSEGGKNLCGVLFEFDPVTSLYTKRADLRGSMDVHMEGQLLEAKNGKLYGVLKSRVERKGIIFEYTPNCDTIVLKAEFENPVYETNLGGGLVEGTNGKLYGIATTFTPGIGFLFEYDISTDSLKRLFTFDNKESGLNPIGSLLVASNGNIYGMTNNGGSDNRGVVFEYNYTTHVYTKKFDFKGPVGMNPKNNNNLIEVCKSIPYQGIPTTLFICEDKDYSIPSGLNKNEYTFQWYKDYHPILSATSENLDLKQVTQSDAGIYFCKVSNACRSIQTAYATVTIRPHSDPDCGVGIKEHEKIAFELYPNPATGEVYIRLDKASDNRITVELADILGQSVLQETLILSDKSASLNIRHLENGIYSVKISDASHTIFQNLKLIKH